MVANICIIKIISAALKKKDTKKDTKKNKRKTTKEITIQYVST